MALEGLDYNDPNLNGKLFTFGYNSMGQLGDGDPCLQDKYTPVIVHAGWQDSNDPNGPLQWITAISAGEEHSMALDANEYVYTFGNNASGMLGIDSTVNYCTTPVRVLSGEQDPNNDDTFLKNIVSISAGSDHCMALEGIDGNDPNRNGRIFTWGSNAGGGFGGGGRLGDGSEDDSSTPVLVVDPNDPNLPLTNIVAISAGKLHSMALDENMNVLTFGINSNAQLGDGTDETRLTAVKVVAPDRDLDGVSDDLNGNGVYTDDYLGDDVPIIEISAGYWHCLAIDEEGTLWSWGMVASGRTGHADRENNDPDVAIPLAVGVVKVYDSNDDEKFFTFGLQQAIDAAADGDRLVASPAPYYEDITLLDFFGQTSPLTIESAYPANLDVVEKTIIDGSYSSGSNILIETDDFSFRGFTVKGSQASGIWSAGTGAEIENCIIYNNMVSGIYNKDETATIKNNLIYNNGVGDPEDSKGSGIYLEASSATVQIRNNTIVDNNDYGITKYDGSDDDPNISNCIVWGNSLGQFYDCNGTYSCIEGWGGGLGNITSDPCFVGDVNDYHLYLASRCIDAGNPDEPNQSTLEVDIDGEARIEFAGCNGIVDIGADEAWQWEGPACWKSPTQCHGDIDGNAYVDTEDWPPFRDGFGTSFPEPNYIGNICADYDHNGAIDTDDWPEFRDNFGTSPPADCNAVCIDDWPLSAGESAGAGSGPSMMMSSASSDDEVFDMLWWLMENEMPGWDELMERLTE